MLITEKFQEDVQPVLPILVVPKDVTPEKVLVSIVDTPGQASEEKKVDEEICKADVIVLVYDVTKQSSALRISSYWLQKFRHFHLSVPIVLVGNKIDLRVEDESGVANEKMEAFIKPIMDSFREIDVCIECSAKSLSNISEVFYFAQKAVLYPTSQVYNVETHSLRPKAVAALRRIFKICDKDRDGALDDAELNAFQYFCFNVHLKPAELEGVKNVVQETLPSGGLTPDGSLTVDGFVFLHTLFVQKGRLETTWIVLRTFGYDDQMNIVLQPHEQVTPAPDQGVELSVKGKKFLCDVFAVADKDGDGLLSPRDLADVFADCPLGPFSTKAESVDERLVVAGGGNRTLDYMSLDAFLCRWAMLLLDSLDDALLTLLYLGYTDGVSSAVTVTKSRRRDRYAQTVSREVFSVVVLGSDGKLKTDIVRGLVGLLPLGRDSPRVAASAQVEVSETERKTLVMRHVPDSAMGDMLRSRELMEGVDVVCIVFDAGNKESYEKAQLIYQACEALKPGIKMPIVFVGRAAGVDGNDVTSEADAFCLQNSLPTPTWVDFDSGEYHNLYEDLLGVALYPQVACPDYYESRSYGPSVKSVVKVAVGIGLTGVMVYGAKRLYDYYSTKPASS